MTKTMQNVIDEASRLPPDEQGTLAARMLEALGSEQHWNERFAQSQVMLAKMADEALAEHIAGQTLSLDPDMLRLRTRRSHFVTPYRSYRKSIRTQARADYRRFHAEPYRSGLHCKKAHQDRQAY